MSTVLITGATGFLGREVARHLLAAEPELRLIALVRARDEAQLARRRARIVDGLPDEQAGRFEVVRGDLVHPLLGLDSRGYHELVARVDRVVHVAATVAFTHTLDQARRINVGGTEQVLALCRAVRDRGGSGRLDYVGTAYVAGDRQGRATEDELEVGQRFRNTYEQSKCEAERHCRDAMAELPVAIHRPSIIVGDSRTGQTSSYKTIYWPMKLIVRFYGLSRPVLPRIVRLPVAPDCRLDIVPVDWVAAAVVQLFQREDAAGHAFHLAAGDEAATIRALVDAACDHFGVARLRYLDPEGPLRRVARAARPLLVRLAPRVVENGERILEYAIRNPLFDTTHARAFGLAPPRIEEYYLRLIDFAYTRDFGRAG